MRVSVRRSRRVVAVSLALLLATSACSFGESSETGGAGDGELNVAGPIPIENLDPHGPAGMDAGTQLAARAIFSQLVISTGSGEFKGELAEKWTPNDDASQWTITLRKGVTYSDGTAVTAQDVVTSFQRVLAAAGPLAGNFGGYTVAAPSPDTVVFTSGAPDAAFPGKISSFFVTPPQAAEDGFFAKPVGSGPYVVKSFEPGQELRLAPNPRYWDGKPELKALVFQSIPEVSARMTALRTGEADVTWNMPDDQIAQLESDQNITVKSVPGPAVLTMWMNSSVPSLKDAAVRRALWQAVDFKSIVKSLYPETGVVADSVVSPAVFGYAPQDPVTHDAKAAKEALERAGFDFNTTIRFQFSQPNFRQFVQAVVSDLAEIGVKVEPLEKEQAVFLDDLLAMNWDMNLQQLGSQGFDAATNLGRLYPCAAGRTGYCNPDLDQLLATAGATSDAAEREDLYAQAIEIVWTDAVGMYPMFVEQPYAWRNAVKGFVPSPEAMPYFAKVTVSGD